MPVKDGSALRVRLVDGGCSSFEHRRSGRIWRVTREQEISTQAWRIPQEKITINGVEENFGVYAKEQCSIPAGMGKYIPVQTNREIQGNFLVKINDKTVTGLILPEIVYIVKRKLGSNREEKQ